MRKALLMLALATRRECRRGAGANGSPYSPGLMYGWAGARCEGERPSAGRVRDAEVDDRRGRSRTRRGGRAEPGPSGLLRRPDRRVRRDARRCVGRRELARSRLLRPLPGIAGSNPLRVLSAETLEVRREIALRGSWSYDAVSPDAATLFLVEHISVGASPRYRVRALDSLQAGSSPSRWSTPERTRLSCAGGLQPASRAATGAGRTRSTRGRRTSRSCTRSTRNGQGRSASTCRWSWGATADGLPAGART